MYKKLSVSTLQSRLKIQAVATSQFVTCDSLVMRFSTLYVKKSILNSTVWWVLVRVILKYQNARILLLHVYLKNVDCYNGLIQNLN